MRMQRLLIIHGFNSSPGSMKAQLTMAYFDKHFPQIKVHAPQLKSSPLQALQQLQDIIASQPNAHWYITGSSLGGFFATYLSEQYGHKAVLINPAVRPFELLQDVIGEQTNPYTNETYHVLPQHMQQLQDMYQNRIDANNYMVMVQTGDEVLDYRQAVEKYQHSHLIVQQGGDHSFIDFEKMLPVIVKFFQLENNGHSERA
ncbi:esterase YqiA [Thalassotalea sp. Y01]|nr:esterase YqiA [Thalassotalea sp. Y01]